MEAFLGIDVSKGYADFLLLNGSFEQVEPPFQLDDTSSGHQALNKWLADVIKQHKINQVYCAVESTGGFENNWFSLLFRLGDTLPVQVSRLNPSVVKNATRAVLKDQVTDALSARNIAAYLIRYTDQVTFQQPDNKYRSFRSLHNHIRLLTKQKSQMVQELKQLLYSCFPELQRFCKQGVPAWTLDLLTQYPTAKKLSRAKATKVARIKGVTTARAEELVEKAKGSVGARGEDTDGFLIKSMAEDIKAKQKRLKELKQLLEQNCKGKEVELLQSITGIGAYSAACIMIEIEHIERFASPKKLAGYFGVYPTLKESGDKKAVPRMSKKGRSAIRATLYMCANSAVLFDPHLKATYHKHRAAGKKHKQALGVVMHKMLRIIWGVLTSGKPYDAAIDISNQPEEESQKQVGQQEEIESKRRLQQYDEDAPISRIATKKRKAHQTSQVSMADQMRDLVDAPYEQT